MTNGDTSDIDDTGDVRFPDVHVELTALNGNVFILIGAVTGALRRAGHFDAAQDFVHEATGSTSYDEVLQLIMRTVEVS